MLPDGINSFTECLTGVYRMAECLRGLNLRREVFPRAGYRSSYLPGVYRMAGSSSPAYQQVAFLRVFRRLIHRLSAGLKGLLPVPWQ